MKPLHVVHIIPTLRYGGAERFVVDLINASDPEHVRYSLIVFEADGPLEKQIDPEKRHVVVVQKKGQGSLSLFGEIEKVLKDLQADLVHTHLFGGDLWGRVAANRLGIPVVTTEHNINYGESFVKRQIKRILKNCSVLYTAPSHAITRFMKDAYGIRETAVTPFGTNLKRFASIPDVKIAGPLRLVIIGRLSKQKEHITVLRALRLLRDLPLHLEIVGDGEKKEEVERYVSRHNLGDRVEISPATFDVASVFARNHVVVVPSLWEGFGLVAREALASGRILLTSDVGGLIEGVERDVDALFASGNDTEEFAQKIRWIYEHRAEAEKIAAHGRQTAHNNFGFEKTAEKYLELYKELAGTTSRDMV